MPGPSTATSSSTAQSSAHSLPRAPCTQPAAGTQAGSFPDALKRHNPSPVPHGTGDDDPLRMGLRAHRHLGERWPPPHCPRDGAEDSRGNREASGSVRHRRDRQPRPCPGGCGCGAVPCRQGPPGRAVVSSSSNETNRQQLKTKRKQSPRGTSRAGDGGTYLLELGARKGRAKIMETYK